MLRQASRDRGLLDAWVIPLPDWSDAGLPGLRGGGWEMPLVRYLDGHPRGGAGRGGHGAPDGAVQIEFTWQSSAQGHHGHRPPKGAAPWQVAQQDSRFEAAGDPDFAYHVGGRLGGIRDIDVGCDAGEVIQINAVWQSASGGAGGKGSAPAVPQTVAQENWLRVAGEANFFLHVEGNVGSVRDIDVGLVAGSVIQANLEGQCATAGGAGGKKAGGSGGAPDIEQAAAQANWLEATGQVDFFLHVEGNVGSVRDIDVGLVAGSVVQANAAWQAASSPAGKGGAVRSIDQVALQENRLQASGDIDFTLVVEGNVGAIHDIEVGLVAGEILEVNAAAQQASNAGGKNAGAAAPQTIEQVALQQDLILALGDVNVTLVIEGAFRESIHDITLGLVAAEIVQANLSRQQGSNGGGGDGAQTIVQHITQTNLVNGSNGLDVTVTIDAGFAGPAAGIEIGLVVGEILQANNSVQVAINAGDGWCLIA
jgi:hypothetical protein